MLRLSALSIVIEKTILKSNTIHYRSIEPALTPEPMTLGPQISQCGKCFVVYQITMC